MLIYLTTINALGFLLMLSDKHKAKKKAWRIPEAVLFGTAIAGGSLGATLGMYTARHKTKHPLFAVGLPLLMMAHVMLILLLLQAKGLIQL